MLGEREIDERKGEVKVRLVVVMSLKCGHGGHWSWERKIERKGENGRKWECSRDWERVVGDLRLGQVGLHPIIWCSTI